MSLKHNKKEKIAALILFLFSIVYLFASLKLKMGTVSNPGAGIYPLIISLLLLICSLIYFYKVYKIDSKDDVKKKYELKDFFAPFAIAASLLVYPFLLSTLNFFISTYILVFLIFLFLRYKGLLFSLLTAFIITFVAYLVFVQLLGVVLPTGEVERFISRYLNIIL